MHLADFFKPPAESGQLFLLSCSPRPRGNSDAAAREFGRACAKERVKPVFLREYRVEPCVACGSCSRAAEGVARGMPVFGHLPFGCPFTLKDDSSALLHRLATAPAICLVSPIFFYHLPAQLKALIDRTQPFFAMQRFGFSLFDRSATRPCHLILIAGREHGERLFEGSLLTLKYALEPLGVSLAEPLLLRGLDGPRELEARHDSMLQVIEYARRVASA